MKEKFVKLPGHDSNCADEVDTWSDAVLSESLDSLELSGAAPQPDAVMMANSPTTPPY
jgi:hypothetical protein